MNENNFTPRLKGMLFTHEGLFLICEVAYENGVYVPLGNAGYAFFEEITGQNRLDIIKRYALSEFYCQGGIHRFSHMVKDASKTAYSTTFVEYVDHVLLARPDCVRLAMKNEISERIFGGK